MPAISQAEKAQKAAQDKANRAAALQSLQGLMVQTDVPAGFSVASTGAYPAQGSPWLTKMAKFQEDLSYNARVYNNFVRSKTKFSTSKRQNKQVISAEGFPAWVTVSYMAPPPFAFQSPYMKPVNGMRDVRFFVLHSFGHGWHADIKGKVGWLNSTDGKRGAQSIQFNDGTGTRTIFIPMGSSPAVVGGTDPTSFQHFSRFSAGLSACVAGNASATAHYFIDRAGNLFVIGDCNDVMYTSGGINSYQLGVELEESFYVLEDPHKTKAKWGPGKKTGSSPAGTVGNVVYFTYSPEQLFTLSILIRKLQIVFPKLQTRNAMFQPGSVTENSSPGFLMHNAIQGAPHMDVSPHFMDQKAWDALFDLVATHTHINATNVFLQGNASTTGGEAPVKPLDTAADSNIKTHMLAYAKTQGLGKERVDMILNWPKGDNTAGNNAAAESEKVAQQIASTVSAVNSVDTAVLDLPGDDLQPNGEEDFYASGSDA